MKVKMPTPQRIEMNKLIEKELKGYILDMLSDENINDNIIKPMFKGGIQDNDSVKTKLYLIIQKYAVNPHKDEILERINKLFLEKAKSFRAKIRSNK